MDLGDIMANTKMIRDRECEEITGLCRTTRRRLEKKGLFPARRQITEGTVGWLQEEIEEWLKSRAVAIPYRGNNE